jgi:hypothetical protein
MVSSPLCQPQPAAEEPGISSCLAVNMRLVACGSSHHLRWYEPPQMSTSSARDGNEVSTKVNRCSHLDEHNVSQGMSKDITAACQ